MVKSKAEFTTIGISRKLKDDIVFLRNANNKYESLHGFVARLVEAYKKTHCPECGSELTMKECPCKAPERI